jgi:hypothetical protein
MKNCGLANAECGFGERVQVPAHEFRNPHSSFRIGIGCPGWIRTINIRCQRPAFCWLNYRAWCSWPDSHRLTTGLKGPPLDCLALTNKQMAHEASIAPASPPLQGGANLSQLLVAGLAEPKPSERRLVLPRGNAPRSSAYQAGALLLSYRRVLNPDLRGHRR